MVLWVAAAVAAAFAASSAGQGGPPGGAPPGLDKAIAAKQKHAERMLDKPGVAGIAVALKPNGKPFIQIYKEKDDVPDLPTELDGVEVESVTTGVLEPYDHDPTHRYPRPVPIGVSAGLAGVATGTLGARVTDGTNSYVLSNNHVLAGINSAAAGDPIISPGDADGGSDPDDRIATLTAFQQIDFDGGDNVMDAAIALTSAANVGTATDDYGYGNPSTVTAEASLGLAVQKVGRTTGFQQGTVAGTNVSVDVCYLLLFEFCLQEARFVGQISISPGPFSAPGDSGSLVVTQGGNQPVGLLFAGGDGLTIANPIDAVLQRFGVSIEGQPAGDGPPGAPTALAAVPGDASVSLTWNAPTFDGGSQIANYKVYRGTTPNPTVVVGSPGGTSFDDTGLTNGQTYYYRVSAVNGTGEGPLSSQVSSTPSALVPPSAPLPTLDAFNRADENPLSDAGRWTNGVNGSVETGFVTTANQLACTKTTTCTAWRNTTQYGSDVEVWARLSVLPGADNQLRLYARLQGVGTGTYDGYMVRPNQLAGTDQILFERVDNGVIVNLLTVNQELSAGDVFLLRVTGSTMETWRHDGSSWSRLGTVVDTTYPAAGYAGVGLRGTSGRADDFGARSLSQSPPGAPTALAAVPGDASVSLTWNAPTFDGGSQIANYKVYRGTTPNPTVVVGSPGGTSFDDTGLTNGQTYYYRVSAVNGTAEGPASSEASATPVALVPPAAPLATIDNFDRGFESPLSDAGRWTNGVNGGGEAGLYVPSIWLSCSKSTTCTSWRNDAQHGPDTEVYARVGVLPGNSNQFRLYARLRQQGTAGYDGYMLRTNHLAGTDQVWIERVDNDTFFTLKAIDQEIAVGDVLLLRAVGQTLEAWRHDGTSWSRLGMVSDATYATGGYVGVGIRGTTGRLDDFGARTMGAPAQDTTPPTAPGTLTASVFSDSQIELTWGAASDDVGPISYRVERCSGSGCSNFAEIAAGTSTTHMDVGLAAATDYSYRVRAVDAADNEGPYSNVATATTSAPPDTEAPTAPTNLNASATSPTQVDLTWDAASDNVQVTLYRIERCQGAGCSDFGEIATTASTSYANTDLTAATSYTYRVRAQDGVPNLGPYSGTASATTSAPPDTEAPTAPTNLNAGATSPSQIDLSWQAAADNVGVTLYRIERCAGAGCSDFGEIATTAATSYSNTSLAASTSYTYRVRAEDAVPNPGPYSGTASATTPALPPALPLEPLPTLDSFNRRNENPLRDGGRWSNGIGGSAETGLRVQGNAVECTKTTTCTAWRNDATFGPDVEVWARVTTLPGTNNQFRLYARLQDPVAATQNGYMLRFNQLAGTDQVLLERLDAGAIDTRLTVSQELAAGDTVLLRVKGSTLEAWLKRASTWTLLGSVGDSTYAAAGRVGIGIRGKTGRLDDFGAR